MDFFFGLLVGFVLSFFYWRSVVVKALQTALDKVEQQTDTQDTVTLEVKVEQHDGQFFLFRADTDGFIMQGSSLQDFQSRLKTMNIDQLNIINGTSDAAKSLIKISKQLKEQNENSNNQ
jgi:hypothetical protein